VQFDQKQLFQIARECPWYLFTGEEISELCNVGEDQVRRVRNAPDGPFRYNKCRPEWLTEWMQNHPEPLPVNSLPPPGQLTPSCERCAQAVKEALSNKLAKTRKASRKKRKGT
jgi:hypothetical protein